jgi:hypothetical protein
MIIGCCHRGKQGGRISASVWLFKNKSITMRGNMNVKVKEDQNF